MTAFRYMQVSAMTLAICAYFIAHKYGDIGTAYGVCIGYMTVWVPMSVWVLTRKDAP
jgi:hypothetical protein